MAELTSFTVNGTTVNIDKDRWERELMELLESDASAEEFIRTHLEEIIIKFFEKSAEETVHKILYGDPESDVRPSGFLCVDWRKAQDV